MSFLSSKTESELLPLLHSVRPLQEFIGKAEELLGTPIRFCPGGNLNMPIESPSYPHDDTLLVLTYLNAGLDCSSAQRRKMDVFRMFDPQKSVLENSIKPRRILSWVLLGERCLGHISIPELHLPLETVDLEQVEVICRYLALACAANDMAQDGDVQERALSGLLSGTIAAFAHLLYALKGQVPEMGNEYRLVAFRMDSVMPPEYLKNVLKQSLTGAWWTCYDGYLVSLLPARLVEQREKAFAGLAASSRTAACIGEAYSDIMETGRRFERLRSLTPFLRAAPGEVVYFDRHRENALFELVGSGRELADLCCCDIIRQIRAYDAERSAKWYETLRAYLRNDRVLSSTAGALGVHVNTVQYRLSKMQERFGFDLARSDVLFRVMLSIRALEESEYRSS